MSIAVNLLVLMIIIGVHEYGHMWSAKRYGLAVPEFSIGVGYKLFTFFFRGTEYSLRAIPLGGFVQISESDLEKATKKQRIVILLSGPIANLLLCIAFSVPMALGPYAGHPYLADLSTVIIIIFAILGTIVAFIVSIPVTIYALFVIFLHPIDSMNTVAGPIGLISGEGVGVPLDIPLFTHFIIYTYVLSLAIGTINLVPMSILDGGRIFSEVLAEKKVFIKYWQIGTSGLLVALMIYIISTDIFKLVT